MPVGNHLVDINCSAIGSHSVTNIKQADRQDDGIATCIARKHRYDSGDGRIKWRYLLSDNVRSHGFISVCMLAQGTR